jgi:hypothetical protein
VNQRRRRSSDDYQCRYLDFMPYVPSFHEGFLCGPTKGSHQAEGNNIASGW